MTKINEAINKIFIEDGLKEYDVINLDYVGFYLKYGNNIVTHNVVPTIRAKIGLAVVVKE